MTDTVEVQIATSWNEAETHAHGNTERSDGRGDLSFAIKAALPSSHPDFSWATLAAVTDANGARAFRTEGTTYDLGVALGYSLSEHVAAEFYANAERADGTSRFDVSPNLNFSISSTIAAFIEAAAAYSGHGLDQALAGGGFTLMLTPSVQLDLSADFGLRRAVQTCLPVSGYRCSSDEAAAIVARDVAQTAAPYPRAVVRAGVGRCRHRPSGHRWIPSRAHGALHARSSRHRAHGARMGHRRRRFVAG